MSFFRLTDKTAGTKPAEEAGSTGFRRAVRIVRTVLICFAAALYVFYFITNLRAMSIGGGILSSSLLALFTFAAYKAVPLVLKTLIGERLCSFVPVRTPAGIFLGLCLPRWRFTLLQPFSEW